MDILFLIGRILFGGYFLWNGLNHVAFGTQALTGYAQSKGVPTPKLAVLGSGLLLLAGGLGIFLGIYIEWAVVCLALFLVPVSFKMHNFWAVTDPMQKMMEMVQFTKNMALLGGALMLLAVPAPWPLSVTL